MGNSKQTSDVRYKDQDGLPCTLLNLIKDEPEWAESRIVHMREELGRLKDDIENLSTFDHTFASTGGLTKHKHAVQEAARKLRYFKSKGIF